MNTRSYILKIIFTLFYAAAFYNCGGNKNDGNPADFISNDSTKLGVEIIDKDLGVKFFPPKDWVLMQSSLSKKVENRKGISNPADNFIYQPVYVFLDNQTHGFLSIGTVSTGDSALHNSAVLNYYKGLVSSKYKDNNLSIGSFTNSGITFTQFKFTKENLISLKLVFQNSSSEIIQLDYTVPAEFQNSSDSAIRSSIGSIKLY